MRHIKKIVSDAFSASSGAAWSIRHAFNPYRPGNGVNSWNSYHFRAAANIAWRHFFEVKAQDFILEYHKLREEASLGLGDSPLPPDFHDIKTLLYLVNLLKASTVLEYGSGNSSIGFISSLLSDNSTLKSFESVESSQEWYAQNLKATLSVFGDSRVVRDTLVSSPAEVVSFGGVKTYLHSYVPKFKRYDFIYLDGPTLVNANSALDIVQKCIFDDQTVVMVDGRDFNAQILFRHMREAGKNWDKITLGFPSNDTLIINKSHPRYALVAESLSALLS